MGGGDVLRVELSLTCGEALHIERIAACESGVVALHGRHEGGIKLTTTAIQP
ncbi:hypothetical protein [Sorangium sp. So ce1151]|uniref:hypothetical protein n=1 Tax=Sorangium sp. So ce1151 TaxID=3133332 RepID=UPI003F6057F4